ncbi:initiator tRNA phosphoribosyl transferase [Polychaeton citri CBS 116435]|uniref:Initiator tRNA phosphoribosyl transferase n=1 Tax=Polychaeton citri CBS 116435 TaxID=1314669 RepID=A0A9P4UKZ8_9PEZI|nr:initiator tRNA phosphoribosyl transferase [Polychaeton citri CBS 116435]
MGTTKPLRESDILFPSANILGNKANNFNAALGELKRSNLSLKNRFRSIQHDADFVCRVASQLRLLPLIANERCGSWYIPPAYKAGSAYFKSTDGHHGQWSFSLRRLNLHLLDVIGRHGGCIIVDSTRRGKSMPDALSKTVPIWIAVLNRILFPDIRRPGLLTSASVVGESEQSQMVARLETFVSDVQTLDLDLGAMRKKLKDKPMRPFWVTPDSDIGMVVPDSAYHAVVLCTASSRSSSADATGGYVQGAADDAESWALGLDPVTFWNNTIVLSETSEDHLPKVVAELLSKKASQPDNIEHGGDVLASDKRLRLVEPSKCVFITDNATADAIRNDYSLVISCSEKPRMSSCQKDLHLQCKHGKIGSRQLRQELGKVFAAGSPLRKLCEDAEPKILVADHEGEPRDLSVGVALAIICILCKDDGTLDPQILGLLASDSNAPLGSLTISKTIIKKRLSWIMIALPDAKPSRATLQSVNAFLLS